jgi:hypothetical protein
VDRVRPWWESYHVHGSPSYILAQKLRALRDIKTWMTKSLEMWVLSIRRGLKN